MNKKIFIIGAGLSGLAAAITLEKAGFSPVIFESTSKAGGRIKTDIFEGYQLDHGFQVLLDAYPKALEYFDYKELELQKILPGAILFYKGRSVAIGDPSRHPGFLFTTILSGVAGVKDVYRLLVLYRDLQKMTDEEIFSSEEMSTLNFLKKRKFSNGLIAKFFKPFFSGIFLEPDLKTSCRMFQFVFKMFARGSAVIPKAGMGALAEQLVKKLEKTEIHYNSRVERVSDGEVWLQSGEKYKADAIVVAAEPGILSASAEPSELKWNSCETLYFEVDRRTIKKPIIGLVRDPNAIINNIFYHTSISCAHKGEKELLSVTIVKDHNLTKEDLITQVIEELKVYCKIDKVDFLKHYQIKRALPSLESLKAQWPGNIGKAGKSIFLAGDHLLYASSNAALISGEGAAKAVIEKLR
ncbi:MAG: NAD(P)-binding protein [Eudoraea sp.]|nr:NAD(P)-binding protein [Eudoraea sp.]